MRIHALIALAIALSLCGCGNFSLFPEKEKPRGGKISVAAADAAVAAEKSRTRAAEGKAEMTLQDLKDARADAVRDRMDLDVRVADFDREIKVAQEEKDNHISRLIGWGLFVGALLAIVGAFATPLKSTFIKLASGFTAASIGAFLFAAYRVYIEWGALVVIVLAAVIFLLRATPIIHTFFESIPHLKAIEDKLSDRARATIARFT